ncbi:hypothetical protein CBL_11743 [Carabus blaptoides fortunei]
MFPPCLFSKTYHRNNNPSPCFKFKNKRKAFNLVSRSFGVLGIKQHTQGSFRVAEGVQRTRQLYGTRRCTCSSSVQVIFRSSSAAKAARYISREPLPHPQQEPELL